VTIVDWLLDSDPVLSKNSAQPTLGRCRTIVVTEEATNALTSPDAVVRLNSNALDQVVAEP
jgi:hypothetical protein